MKTPILILTVLTITLCISCKPNDLTHEQARSKIASCRDYPKKSPVKFYTSDCTMTRGIFRGHNEPLIADGYVTETQSEGMFGCDYWTLTETGKKYMVGNPVKERDPITGHVTEYQMVEDYTEDIIKVSEVRKLKDGSCDVFLTIKRSYSPFGKHKFVMGHRGGYQDEARIERVNFVYQDGEWRCM